MMRRLFLSSLGVNLFVMVVNVCTGTLTARLLGPYARGELAIATRWSGLFVMLFTLGLPGAVIYLGKQFSQKQRDYLGAYLLLGSSIGLLGMFIGEFLLPHLLGKQPRSVIRLAEFSMCSVTFGVLADGLVGSLQALNQFKKVLSLRVMNEFGTLIVIFILLLVRDYGVGRYIISNMAWSFMIFLVTLFWVCKAIPPRFINMSGNIKQLFVKGVQIYAGSLVNVFGGNLDQLIISLFLSPYTLGLYTICTSISGLLPSLITSSVLIFLWPKLMDMAPEDRPDPVQRLHSSLFYSSLSMCCVIGGLLPIILPLMYGHQYAGAVPIGEVLLFSGPMTVGYVVLVNYLSTLGKFGTVTVAEIIALILGICSTYPLSHMFGGVGAAIGVLVTSCSKWLFLVIATSRHGVSSLCLMRPDLDTIAILRSFLHRHVLRPKVEGSSS